MLKNLVLDIGNVICEWNPQKLVASAFDNPDDHAPAIAATIAHNDWIELDRGTLKKSDAISRAQRRCDLDPANVAQLYEKLPASLTPLQPTIDAMYEFAEKGISIYILSNMHDYAWEYLRTQYSCWETCQGVVVSCAVGSVKPESEIYQHVCERFSLNASECVFIDDMIENVEAAIANGWQSVQLKNPLSGGELIRSLETDFG